MLARAGRYVRNGLAVTGGLVVVGGLVVSQTIAPMRKVIGHHTTDLCTEVITLRHPQQQKQS